MQSTVSRALPLFCNSNRCFLRRFVTSKPAVTSDTVSFLEELGKKYNVQKLDDWYEVDSKAVSSDYGGQDLVKQFGGLASLITAAYPHHNWKIWHFKTVPTGYWNDEKNQEEYMKWLGEQLNITDQEGWYNVTWEDMIKYDGSYLLKKYSNSPPFVIMNTLKEYKWDIWKFRKIPKPILAKLRTDLTVQKEFLNYLMKEEYLTSVDELLSITKQKLRKYASLTHMEYINLVKTVYPETNSSEYGLFRHKTQKILFNYIKVLFPDEEIRSNDRTTVKTQIGTPLELDIYLPVKQIAFEYQGEQHYSYVKKFGSRNLFEIQLKDANKLEACKRIGITLVTIPYWWDLSIHSLISTIRKIRPDLTLYDRDNSKADPIPETNPKPNNKAEEHLTAIKEVEKSIMLATYWNSDMSTVGWWMSEKFDGIRAYWDKTKLISRNGYTINAPSWFLSSLPNDIALDGELWVKYGGYREAQTLSVSSSDRFWKDAKFMVFDVVDYTLPFEYRYNLLKNIKFSTSFIQYVEHTLCKSEEEFKKYFEQVKSHNGEGIMLSKAESMYIPGRSNDLRKYKGFLTTEVKVVRDTPNGLLCEQLNGETIIVAHPTMSLTTTLLPPDSIVTVKYEGINSAGQLHYSHRYPIFIKKRTDVDWQYLLYRYNEDNNKNVTT